MTDTPTPGDIDPEDEWDDSDPIEDKVGILERIVEELRSGPDERRAARRAEVDRLLDKLLAARDELVARIDRIVDALEAL